MQVASQGVVAVWGGRLVYLLRSDHSRLVFHSRGRAPMRPADDRFLELVAGPVVAQPLALAPAHVVVRGVLPLGLADLRAAAGRLAVRPAAHRAVVAAPADVEQAKAPPAALLAK